MAEISETIARANLANIVRKLKAGKTLSSAERAAVQTDSINGKELSEMIGCGTRHLINLEKTGVIKKTGYGEWALRESVKGFCAYQRAQIEAKGENVYDEAKTRKMVADADISEIEAAKAAGKLVVAKFVGSAWTTAISVAMTKLGSIGNKIGAVVILERTAAGAGVKINDAIRGACEELFEMDIAALAQAKEEEESLRANNEKAAP